MSPEQMELARLRAQLARVTMERDILKKPRRTSLGNRCEVRPDSQQQSALAHHLACEVLGVSASGYFENGRRKKLPQPSKLVHTSA